MPAATIPANENVRQLALEAYGLFGTQADEVFDSIISIAANMCDVPISVIGLIDRERQWFFARKGMPREETSRSDALCAHAILDYQLMEVFEARRVLRPVCLHSLSQAKDRARAPLHRPEKSAHQHNKYCSLASHKSGHSSHHHAMQAVP